MVEVLEALAELSRDGFCRARVLSFGVRRCRETKCEHRRNGFPRPAGARKQADKASAKYDVCNFMAA